MEKKEAKLEYLLSVKNALRILRSFSMDEPEKGVRELAKSLGLGKSTVGRLMTTLASEGFVTKNPQTQHYRLGVSVLALCNIFTSNLVLYQEAVPYLHRLVEKIGETAHLGVLEGTDVVYLHKVDCKNQFRITHIGKRSRAHCSGCGKAILAFQSEEVIEAVITNGLQSVTPYSVTDPEEFRDQLKKIREQGYAIGMEEQFEGIVSIAAPIRDYTGQVIAAVNVIGPTERLKMKNITDYAKEVVKTAKEISNELGFWK